MRAKSVRETPLSKENLFKSSSLIRFSNLLEWFEDAFNSEATVTMRIAYDEADFEISLIFHHFYGLYRSWGLRTLFSNFHTCKKVAGDLGLELISCYNNNAY